VNILLWILAGLLAAMILLAGVMKVAVPKEKLLGIMAWAKTWPDARLKALGVVEVLGAVGLILPPLTGVAPALALAAATGLVLIQVGGISLHLSRGEVKVVGLNVALLVLAGVEIWLATVWL